MCYIWPRAVWRPRQTATTPVCTGLYPFFFLNLLSFFFISFSNLTHIAIQVDDIDVFRPESFRDGFKLMRGVSALGTLLVDQATQADGRVVDRARAWCHSTDVPFFRFCPQMSEEINMDEKDDQKLVNMLWETKVYMVQNHTEVLKLVSLLQS